MKMIGSRTIAAPPETVFAAMLDPEILKASVPGCTEMSGNADDGFEASVTQKVGPVKATFKGKVTLEDLEPPKGLRLSGEGKGGAAGFAKGGATVSLAPIPGGTALTYEVDARVGGKLAQLGSRIVDAFAARMADQFFERFAEAVAPGQDAPDMPDTAEAAAEPATAPAATPEPELAMAGDAPAPAAHEPATPQKKGWLSRLFGGK